MQSRWVAIAVLLAAGCGEGAKGGIDGAVGDDPDGAAAAVDGAAADAPAVDGPAVVSDATPDPDTSPAADGGGSGTCGGDCALEEYCETPAGECDAPGECLLRPLACDLEKALVCGCDGETYVNDCVRRMSGVGELHKGACAPACDMVPPVGCCFDDGDCAVPGDVCYGELCAVDGPGRCESKPVPGECWDESDCHLGESCDGASICPCGAACLAPDTPGDCIETICPLGPTIDGCCFADGDCPPESPRCYYSVCDDGGEGRCEPKPEPGMCWDSGDCPDGEFCMGSIACKCGMPCPEPDTPGSCEPIFF